MKYINNNLGYIAVALTVFFGVYSQIIIKWQVNQAGSLPIDTSGKLQFIFHLLINPWVISSFLAFFFAGVSWMIAMSKFDLSYAYPFMSSIYVLMMAAGFLLFNEPVTSGKIIGTALIMVGLMFLIKN